MSLQQQRSFTAEYVAADMPLTALIAKHGRQDPILAVLNALAQNMPEALRLAAEADLSQVDPQFAIIFLCFWSTVSQAHGRLTESHALLNRARTLVDAKTPAVIAVMPEMQAAGNAEYSGDFNEAEKIAAAVLKPLQPKMPRYKRLLGWQCHFPSAHGRIEEVSKELKWLTKVCSDTYTAAYVAQVKATGYVEAGRVAEAITAIADWERDKALIKVTADSLARCHEILNLIQGHWPHGKLIPPPATDAKKPSACGWSSWALLQGDTALALAWARHAAQELPNLYVRSFYGFALIRAELSAGNIAAARHLLELRHKQGAHHYLDDFFFARAELFAGDRAAAMARFERMLKLVRKYRAEGRLEFELELAHELKPDTLAEFQARLGSPSAAVQASTAAHARPELSRTLIGQSAQLETLRKTILRFAPLPTPVLVTGETGTGKELVCRALHDLGPRGKKPFVAINCGAIAETLLESELFGHARGAFTGAERERPGLFEAAADGTLMLDEIGEISPRLQIALLRVLESGEIRPVGGDRVRQIRCRILFATNANLELLARAGKFRQDLLYRLRRLEINIPPLRERAEDVAELAHHFLNIGRLDGQTARMSADLSAALMGYAWPGNVRELRNEMERLRLLHSEKTEYSLADLADRLKANLNKVGTIQEIMPPDFPLQSGQMAAGTDNEESFLLQGRTALRRRGRLRVLFKKHKTLTRTEVAHLQKVALSTATLDLKKLCEENWIRKIQPSASPASHYFELI